MEAARRRQVIQLAVLGTVLAALVWFVLLPALAPAAVAPAGPVTATGGRAPVGSKTGGGPPNVRLESLGRATAEPAESDGGRRNPFRMGAAPPPPAPEGTTAMRVPPKPATPIATEPMVPAGPPPPPPIPYRFIGILSGAPGQGRIAVLTDGKTVVHGAVNANIEGRYRIVQIGEESLQIEYMDGRGRQTLRLLGQ